MTQNKQSDRQYLNRDGRSCRGCRFWNDIECCVRFPPTLLRRTVFPVGDPDRPMSLDSGAWLRTAPDDWCGEHQPDTTPENPT